MRKSRPPRADLTRGEAYSCAPNRPLGSPSRPPSHNAMNSEHDFEAQHQPGTGTIFGFAAIGAILGMALLAGLASLFHLPGGLFLAMGALFGGGIGVSLSAILGQARVNSGL